MAVTEKEIDQFQQFARSKLADNGAELTWQELFQSWMLESSPADERQQVNAIISQGIADIDAGRTRPVERINDETIYNVIFKTPQHHATWIRIADPQDPRATAWFGFNQSSQLMRPVPKFRCQ